MPAGSSLEPEHREQGGQRDYFNWPQAAVGAWMDAAQGSGHPRPLGIGKLSALGDSKTCKGWSQTQRLIYLTTVSDVEGPRLVYNETTGHLEAGGGVRARVARFRSP